MYIYPEITCSGFINPRYRKLQTRGSIDPPQVAFGFINPKERMQVLSGSKGKEMRYSLILFICLILQVAAFAQEKTERTIQKKQNTNPQLEEALKNPTKKHILVDTVINNQETAIAVAEAILFNIYGKDNIIRQRPYDSRLVNGYWLINGTLPDDWVGGVFLIIFNSIDGKVIKLTHGK